jgi:site-specific recombinase XerD
MSASRLEEDAMSAAVPLDSLGRRRSPAAVPGYLAGRPPRSKGRRYPADPPRTEEIIAVMRCCCERPHGLRARGLIVVLWRASLRIQEALDLTELDLDPRRGSVLVRRGKGGHRREVGMDDWGFEHLDSWLKVRQAMPVGPLFCVISGRTSGRAWPPSAARADLKRRAASAGVRRRFVPHQLRHAHALELAHEDVPLNVIQRQLGHRNLGVTSIYLQGIDPNEIIQTVHARRQPMIPASAGLALPLRD